MATMNISLPDEMKVFVEAQMAQEGYASASGYLRALIRDAQKRRAKQELEVKLLEGLQGPTVKMTRKDWIPSNVKHARGWLARRSGHEQDDPPPPEGPAGPGGYLSLPCPRSRVPRCPAFPRPGRSHVYPVGSHAWDRHPGQVGWTQTVLQKPMNRYQQAFRQAKRQRRDLKDQGESVEAGGSDERDFRSGGIAALIQLKMGGG